MQPLQISNPANLAICFFCLLSCDSFSLYTRISTRRERWVKEKGVLSRNWSWNCPRHKLQSHHYRSRRIHHHYVCIHPRIRNRVSLLNLIKKWGPWFSSVVFDVSCTFWSQRMIQAPNAPNARILCCLISLITTKTPTKQPTSNDIPH